MERPRNRWTIRPSTMPRLSAIIHEFTDGNWYTITEIQDKVLSKAPGIFNVDTTRKPHLQKKNQHQQFSRYLGILEQVGILESQPSTSKTGKAPIKRYRITESAKGMIL